MVPCEATGKLVPPQEIVTCAVSGKQVAFDETELCTVTGERAPRPLMVGDAVSREWMLTGAAGRSDRSGRYTHPSRLAVFPWTGRKLFTDEAVLPRATDEQRVVVTHDRDFGRLAIAQGAPFRGILYLRPWAHRPGTRRRDVLGTRVDRG